MNEHKLKPCPHCGKKVYAFKVFGTFYGIACDGCHALFGTAGHYWNDVAQEDIEKKICESWNRRAEQEDPHD